MTGQLAAETALGEVGQLALLAQVRLPEVLRGHALHALPEARLFRGGVEMVEVGIEVAGQQVGIGLADPRRPVDAVGDAEDPVIVDAGPGGVRRLGVEVAHGVGPVREPEAERGHVELGAIAVHPQSELEHALDRHAAAVEERAGEAPHEVGLEALVARRDRRVDREHAVPADGRPRVVEWPALRHQLAGPLGEQQRRMTFVEVPHGGGEAECADRPDAPDPEDQLLVEPHLAPAHVQDVGDRTVRLRVLGQVGVEEQHRDSAHLGQPDRHVEFSVGQLDGHGQRQPVLVLDPAERQPREVVVGVVVFLVPVGVDRLAEVALAIEEADAEERQRHVARGLHVVAGEHAEAARIDAERLVQAVFRTEVRDRSVECLAVASLEPVVGAVGHVPVELGEDVVVLGEELGVVEEARPVDGAADDRDRVPVARPRSPVDERPQSTRPGMPRPVEVVGEAAQPLETRRQREPRGRGRGHADEVHGRG